MFRVIQVFLAIFIVFTLSACSNGDNTNDPQHEGEIVDLYQADVPFDFSLLDDFNTHEVGSSLRLTFNIQDYLEDGKLEKIAIGAIFLDVDDAKRFDVLKNGHTPDLGNMFIDMEMTVFGSRLNFGFPHNLVQKPNIDPAPAFFVVDKDGKKYLLDETATHEYYTIFQEGLTSLQDVELSESAVPLFVALLFQVPKDIKDPMLIISTWKGGDEMVYHGIKLDSQKK